MSTKNKPLFSPKIINIEETVLYQVPVNTVAVISYISVHNTSETPATVTVSTPVKGDISNAGNQLSVKRVAGLESLRLPVAAGEMLESGSSIRAYADVDGAINIRAGGVEIV